MIVSSISFNLRKWNNDLRVQNSGTQSIQNVLAWHVGGISIQRDANIDGISKHFLYLNIVREQLGGKTCFQKKVVRLVRLIQGQKATYRRSQWSSISLPKSPERVIFRFLNGVREWHSHKKKYYQGRRRHIALGWSNLTRIKSNVLYQPSAKLTNLLSYLLFFLSLLSMSNMRSRSV